MHDFRRTTRTFTFAVLATAGLLLSTGCKKDATASGPDPALANMAGAPGTPATGQPTAVLGQTASYNGQQTGENYEADPNYDQGYNNGETQGQTVYEQTAAPPPLRRYDQPAAPGPGYVWTPGYWGSGPNGYVWVNGAWVRPPHTGYLWTPPYWAYANSRYRFHHGYWGPHVGYYGGVDYGNGYIGTGYYGGYWGGPNFYYNTSVNHIGPGISFIYNRPVVYGGYNYGFYPRSFVSFNGGPGGIVWAPRGYELAAMRERHFAPYGVQLEFGHAAGIGYARGFEPRGFEGHGFEGRGFIEHDHFEGREHFEDRGHFDNGWHGRKNEGGERGDWHGNGGGHGGEGHGGGEHGGGGHGEGHGGGHGGGHGH